MSNSKLEKLVQGLQKSILELTKKVDSLEAVVIKQNNLIQTQVDTISKLSKQRAASSNTSELEDSNALLLVNRPIRAARQRVPLATNVNVNRKKHEDTQRNVSPRTAASASEDECAAADNNSLAPMSNNTAGDDATFSTQPADHWIQVKNKRKNVMRGSAAPGNSLIEASERWKYYHLYYVKAGTLADKITEHLNNACSIDNCTVEALKSRGNYASFKVGVLAKQSHLFMDVNKWPEDVCIKPWRNNNFRKPSSDS
ncbi:unnamed protein product [Colias eurytheme]|nr:unnamed protein product [Colias eurytheme]